MLNNTVKANGSFQTVSDLHVDLMEVGLINYNLVTLSTAGEDEQGKDFEDAQWYLEVTFDTADSKSSQVFIEAINESYSDLSSLVYTYGSDKAYKEFVFHNGQLS